MLAGHVCPFAHNQKTFLLDPVVKSEGDKSLFLVGCHRDANSGISAAKLLTSVGLPLSRSWLRVFSSQEFGAGLLALAPEALFGNLAHTKAHALFHKFGLSGRTVRVFFYSDIGNFYPHFAPTF